MPIRAFCVHGHFYQPPREDPLTGVIPAEPGAAPYHDWNERIFYECYRPNADLGNFGKISYNIGPTLFEWLQRYDLSTYHKIIELDRISLQHTGSGNAIAQSYNHTILPLANYHDKVTQVRWGIADFTHRFNRSPKGMWLPETAVDAETLEVLVDHGIEFTILAPWQVNGPLPTNGQPGWVTLPGSKKIAIFFYNQDLSTRLSFDPAVSVNADEFVINMLSSYLPGKDLINNESALVMVASDGELYGHHQSFRDKFLSYLLDGALTGRGYTLTFPELWLQMHPPREIVEIRENTSWSCLHGLSRWSGDCACTSHNSWKSPLRKALNEIARQIDLIYLNSVKDLVPDPWELRHRYIRVYLEEQTLPDLMGELSGKTYNSDELTKIKILLRAQYERQRMFTSCGWFFEDFDRIEPRNNVAYAAQAIFLIHMATGIDLTGLAFRLFEKVRSHRSGLLASTTFKNHILRAQDSLSES
jgi:alpha-amylase/alpha-mannosidase (GH57 family)